MFTMCVCVCACVCVCVCARARMCIPYHLMWSFNVVSGEEHNQEHHHTCNSNLVGKNTARKMRNTSLEYRSIHQLPPDSFYVSTTHLLKAFATSI